MATLTPFQLTPLGLFHTLVSLVAVVLGVLAIVRDKGVSPKTPIGRAYLAALVVTTMTGLPIFRRGAIEPPHVLGILTLVVLAIAAVAEKTQVFGRATAYVKTICYSMTLLFMLIPTVTETLTRVPPGAPLVAGPDAPIFMVLNPIMILAFLIGVTMQVRRLRAAPAR